MMIPRDDLGKSKNQENQIISSNQNTRAAS